MFTLRVIACGAAGASAPDKEPALRLPSSGLALSSTLSFCALRVLPALRGKPDKSILNGDAFHSADLVR